MAKRIDPMEDWDGWRRQVFRQIKQLFVLICVTLSLAIGLLIHRGEWAALPGLIVGLGAACNGRFIVYLSEHGVFDGRR